MQSAQQEYDDEADVELSDLQANLHTPGEQIWWNFLQIEMLSHMVIIILGASCLFKFSEHDTGQE